MMLSSPLMRCFSEQPPCFVAFWLEMFLPSSVRIVEITFLHASIEGGLSERDFVLSVTGCGDSENIFPDFVTAALGWGL